jgi:hypothetical protein
MTYNNLIIPEIYSLGRFVNLVVEMSSFSTAFLSTKWISMEVSEVNSRSKVYMEAIPLPDEGEIYPNKDVPGEEEYFPNEKEVEIEEPPQEVEDPYFPRKGDDLPPEQEEEFPQTDPI